MSSSADKGPIAPGGLDGMPLSLGSSGRTMGDFALIREVGRGAMGEVWLGHDPKLERHVAIKMMRCEIADDPSYIQRFHREAKAVAKLSHANIVQIYTIGEEFGTVYFVMEWIDGDTLGSKIRSGGPIPTSDALKIMSQAVDGLGYAHAQGVIHRDIKPGNIMLDRAGRVKIADFGLAKLADHKTQVTTTGTPMGSPNYMSPESCRGEELDHRSDIYSLGITFYQMLEGEVPYAASSPMSVMFKHVTEALPEPPALRFLDQGAWMDVIRRMTAKSAGDRYQSYDELKLALERVGSTSGGFAVPVGFGTAASFPTPSSGMVSRTDLTLGRSTVTHVSAASPGKFGKVAWGAGAAGVAALAAVAYFMFSDDSPPASSPQSPRTVVASETEHATPIPQIVVPATPFATGGRPSQPGQAPPPSGAGGAGAGGGAPQQGGPPRVILPAELTNAKSLMGAAFEKAYAEYDFVVMAKLLSETAAKTSSPNDKLLLELMRNSATTLSGLRTQISQNAGSTTTGPGAPVVMDPTRGPMTVNGAYADGLTCVDGRGARVQVPWSQIPPIDFMDCAMKMLHPGPHQINALCGLYPAGTEYLPGGSRFPGNNAGGGPPSMQQRAGAGMPGSGPPQR